MKTRKNKSTRAEPYSRGEFGEGTAKQRRADVDDPRQLIDHIDSSLDLSEDELIEGSKEFYDWHWYDHRPSAPAAGRPQIKVLDWNDTDMPRMLVECGRLIRIHVRAPRKNPNHPRRQRDTMLEWSKKASQNSFVAYDPAHPAERLYFLVDPAVRRVIAERFWQENDAPTLDLNQLAYISGGKHGKMKDYPNLMVKPIGVMTAVVYYTDKQGDGPSYYIHKMAELSHHFPILCCDETGRLWIAGGNYTAPTPGITD